MSDCPAPESAFACSRCERYPDSPCPACAARRRRAVRLVIDGGLTVPAAARRMRLPVARIERLLEEHLDQLELAGFAGSHVDVAPLRALIAERRRRDPSLTLRELARRMNTRPAQLERWLGSEAAAADVGPERVKVDVAGRVVRAMGLAPCEFEGC